jgi:hypothetical protein
MQIVNLTPRYANYSSTKRSCYFHEKEMIDWCLWSNVWLGFEGLFDTLLLALSSILSYKPLNVIVFQQRLSNTNLTTF